MDKDTIRKAEDKAMEVTKNTGWPRWVQIAVGAVIGAIAGVLGMLTTGCTYTSSQVAADGATKSRVFAVDAATARDLVKLYGFPQVPVVEVNATK